MNLRLQQRIARMSQLTEEALDQKHRVSGPIATGVGSVRIVMTLVLATSPAWAGGLYAWMLLNELGQYAHYALLSIAPVAIVLGVAQQIETAMKERNFELSPLSAMPDICSTARALIDIDADAKAWRDSVLAQGRQLRGFDYAMMESFHQEKRLTEEAHRVAEEDRVNAEKARADCLAIHGQAV